VIRIPSASPASTSSIRHWQVWRGSDTWMRAPRMRALGLTGAEADATVAP
jgi:hypothetical protein